MSWRHPAGGAEGGRTPRGGVVKMEEEVLDSQGDAGMDGQKWGTASPS